MLLGFKPRFRDPILQGTKVFTLRSKRKIEPKIGETLHMYTGLRTPNCQVISKKEKLISTQQVKLLILAEPAFDTIAIWVDGRSLKTQEVEMFIRFDGFTDTADFVNYWVASSNQGKPRKKGQRYRIEDTLTMFHWTDLRF